MANEEIDNTPENIKSDLIGWRNAEENPERKKLLRRAISRIEELENGLREGTVIIKAGLDRLHHTRK